MARGEIRPRGTTNKAARVKAKLELLAAAAVEYAGARAAEMRPDGWTFPREDAQLVLLRAAEDYAVALRG